MKHKILLGFILLAQFAKGQDAIPYQTPPAAIADLALAQPTPGVLFNGKGSQYLVLERSALPGVEELAQPELRIAGLRIHPGIFAPSRTPYYTNILLYSTGKKMGTTITGLPQPLRAGNVSWNDDYSKVAFTHNNGTGIDLYLIDIKLSKASKINKTPLNIVLGTAYEWLGNQTLIYKTILQPASKAPVKPLAPKGPTIQQNLGKVAASVTYQDLIKSPFDELQFEFYASAQLVKNTNGIESKIGQPAIYTAYNPSPNLKYLLVERIDKPYSYLVPAFGFNSTILVTDLTGKTLKSLAQIPSSELAPTGYDNTLPAPRDHEWVATAAAKLIWIEPLDSGLMKKKVAFHDAAYTLEAPFVGQPKLLVQTPMRMANIESVTDSLYFVYERSRAKHRVKLSKFETASNLLTELYDRSTDDAYGDPGTPITAPNQWGRNSIQLIDKSKIWMRGAGASAAGDLPFLSEFDINTKTTVVKWRCVAPYNESVTQVVDFKEGIFITSKQSLTEPPNYYVRILSDSVGSPITHFADPQPILRTLTKQKINYKRKDGVDLTAELYLPAGYNAEKDGRLPVFMWAYPREFKSASDAAQVRGSKYNFTRISWGSPVYWATQGYAVMDNTEFPIVGEGDTQPNDNFVDQLVWNAEAAIQKIHEMGVGDSSRVAVGGHSYGAFMTSNLLAHTKLFKAGISRSGAYNRTLTPFGFQNEERTYWQAPEVYFKMSPFSYANQIKTPLLLIHGEADNNPGTFPIQSERLYNAVKGHGGIVRYVQLPFESHGYASKENILHMLWEMNTWLNNYVKNPKTK